MNLLNKLFIKLFCKYIGKDEFGNKYYQKSKNKGHFDRKDRFVVYKGIVEGSKVPPGWFAWLHHQTDVKPKNKHAHSWQEEYQLNATGTSYAYFPPGHANSVCERSKATGDYQPWIPS